MKLGTVMIFVRDLPRMREFYERDLGLEAVPESAQPGWIELDAGLARLGLHQIPEHVLAELGAEDASPREDQPVKLIFRVADVPAERARLVARGVPMRETAPWGTCDGVDPEGNIFQLAT
mgnify:FL=1